MDNKSESLWVRKYILFTDTESCLKCDYNIPNSEMRTPYCPWCGRKMINWDDTEPIEQMCSSEPFYWETWAGNLLKCPACKYEYTDAVECTNFCGNCGTPLRFKKDGNQNEV